MKKLLILLFFLVLALTPSLQTSANGLPYSTFTYSSSQGRIVPTQDAYLPLSISYNLGGLTLNNPSDITIDDDDNVYIADTGNARIVKYSLRTDVVSVIGEGLLNQPTGVHVGFDGSLYVADFGLKKAYQFLYDEDLDLYNQGAVYEKPTNTPFFAEGDAFDPTKIITDRGNNVYILLAGNINGLAEFENNGNFFGFFGGNQIPNTWDNVLKSILFDEEQRRQWFKMIPKPVYNIAIDHDGLILTTTKGDYGYLKLNIANFVYNRSVWGFDTTEDVFVGPYNTIFSIESGGYIVEYGPDGSVLFIFAGLDQNGQKGLFRSPSGIAVDSKSNIYAIDKTTSALQVFIPTEFANLVHFAIDLYQDGKYSESLEPWQEVLQMNALFDLANKGIGDAYYADLDYESAMQYYQVARDQEGFSNAFWEVRNTALLDSGEVIIFFLLGIILLYFINRFVHFMDYVRKPFKKLKVYLSQFKLYQELVFPFYIIKHPGDGYYGIKREAKGSNLSATIYLLLFFTVYIYWIFETSFLFNNFIPAEINMFQQMTTIFVPFFLWVIANYLVCSIRDGEGKFSDVYQATAYTLLPMIITLPILTIVSNALSFNEAFIYSTIMFIGLFITGLYMVIMVKEIHYYDMKPTIANILISLFTAIMILAVLFIVYLLLNEVYVLISDVIRELIIRG
ncbi:MAG: YIP1 family protein [Firmicutes bacterium]|nr:YIP1 family protein [Bacillota bacterium]